MYCIGHTKQLQWSWEWSQLCYANIIVIHLLVGGPLDNMSQLLTGDTGMLVAWLCWLTSGQGSDAAWLRDNFGCFWSRGVHAWWEVNEKFIQYKTLIWAKAAEVSMHSDDRPQTSLLLHPKDSGLMYTIKRSYVGWWWAPDIQEVLEDWAVCRGSAWDACMSPLHDYMFKGGWALAAGCLWCSATRWAPLHFWHFFLSAEMIYLCTWSLHHQSHRQPLSVSRAQWALAHKALPIPKLEDNDSAFYDDVWRLAYEMWLTEVDTILHPYEAAFE